MNFSHSTPVHRALGAAAAVAFLTAFSVLAFQLQLSPALLASFAAAPTGRDQSASGGGVFTAPGLGAPGRSGSTPEAAQPGAPLPGIQQPPMPLPPGKSLPLNPTPTGPMPPGQLPPGPVPAGMQGNPQVAALFQKALDAQRKGDFKGAAAAYRAVLHQSPDALPAHLNLAMVLLQQKADSEAIAHLKKAIALAPTSPQPRVLLAQAYAQQKNARGAYEQWTKIADLKLPDGGQAAFMAGAIAFEELKKPAEAERWLRRANEQSKGADPRVALLLAKALSAQKKHAQAQQTLEPLGKRFPKAIEIQSALADAQWQSGDKAGAIATLRALEKITPAAANKGANLGQVRLMLARALAQQREYSQAIATLQKALNALPSGSPSIAPLKALLAQTFVGRAEAEEKSGQLDNALATWNEAAKLFPDNPTAFVQRGRLLARQGKNDAALQEYNRALKMLPREAAILEAAAKLEEKTGDATRAMSRWKTLIEVRPEYSPAYFQLARLAAKQNQFAAQMDYLETRLAKNPDVRAAYDAVLEAGQNAGREELARDWVSQMAKKYPQAKAPRNALIAFERRHPKPKPEKTPSPTQPPQPEPNRPPANSPSPKPLSPPPSTPTSGSSSTSEDTNPVAKEQQEG